MSSNSPTASRKKSSMFAGLIVVTGGLFMGLQIGRIPSFFLSFLGLGGVVDFLSGLAGVIGGYALYIHASKRLGSWPMDEPQADNRTMFTRLISPPEPSTLYQDMRSALPKIEAEIRQSIKPENVQWVQDQSGRIFAVLFTTAQQNTSMAAQAASTVVNLANERRPSV